MTGGNAPALYRNHQLHDFRSMDTSMDGYDTKKSAPLVKGDQGTESPPNKYLTSSPFADEWNLQQWSKIVKDDTTVKLVNSPGNFFVTTEGDSTYLTLRTHRFADFQSTAEAESTTKNLHHASIRYRARVRGNAGAVAGMFTFHDDSTESDIEVLTRDPTNQIRYSNQPQMDPAGNYVTASETDQKLPDGMMWDRWNTHRMDWLPEVVSWSINGQNIVNKSYSVPDKPMTLTINMWSDGGTWSEVMAVGDEAFLDLAWVQVLYNTSDADAKGKGKGKKEEDQKACTSICNVDTGQVDTSTPAGGSSLSNSPPPSTAATSASSPSHTGATSTGAQGSATGTAGPISGASSLGNHRASPFIERMGVLVTFSVLSALVLSCGV